MIAKIPVATASARGYEGHIKELEHDEQEDIDETARCAGFVFLLDDRRFGILSLSCLSQQL